MIEELKGVGNKIIEVCQQVKFDKSQRMISKRYHPGTYIWRIDLRDLTVHKVEPIIEDAAEIDWAKTKQYIKLHKKQPNTPFLMPKRRKIIMDDYSLYVMSNSRKNACKKLSKAVLKIFKKYEGL